MHLTIAAAALELGVARETLRTRLVSAGLAPASTERGVEVYRLRDLLRAWYAPAEADPAKMSAFSRRAHFQAAAEEVRLAEKAGRLVPLAEVQRDYALAFQLVAQTFATLPDIVERAGAPLQAVLAVEQALTAAKSELAARLRAEETPPA